MKHRLVMTTGTRGQAVWATLHQSTPVVPIWVNDALVGGARWVDGSLMAETDGDVLPALGEPTAAMDCALYERLEDRLRQGEAPPLPVMPRLPRRVVAVARLEKDDAAA